MTADEVATIFARASNSCEGYKCPFVTVCDGVYGACHLRYVAMLMRAREARIDTLNAKITSLEASNDALQQQINDLMKANKKYQMLCKSYEEHGGAVPARSRGSRNPRRSKPKKLKPLKDPTLMDGDPRYADPNYKKAPKEPPLVII